MTKEAPSQMTELALTPLILELQPGFAMKVKIAVLEKKWESPSDIIKLTECSVSCLG